MAITSQVAQLLESAATSAQLVLITAGLCGPHPPHPMYPQHRVVGGEMVPRRLGDAAREQNPRAGPAEAGRGPPVRAVGGWGAFSS